MKKLYSHPDVELKDHLNIVKDIGIMIFNSKNNFLSNNSKFKKLLEVVLLTHDFGKGTEYFQEYIQNPKGKRINQQLKSHSTFSSICTLKYLNDNFNIDDIEDLKYILFGIIAVKKHHGNLLNLDSKNICFDDDEFEILQKQYEKWNNEYFENNYSFSINEEEFERTLKFFSPYIVYKMTNKIENTFALEDYFTLNYLFSILISADKFAAIFTGKEDYKKYLEIKFKNNKIDKNTVNNYKGIFKDSTGINKIRNQIYDGVEKNILKVQKRIFSINAPTGSGKTLTVLNAAIKLKEKLGNNYKIIYALPFTSIIDQNFEVFNEVLDNPSSEILIKHHYLSEKEYKLPYDSLDVDSSEYFIENWDSQIIVTTFVQLLHSLLSNRNRKLKKFYNFSNSIIILDEVQAVNHKYWKLINIVLKELVEKMNSYLILTTATLPLIFEKEEIEELVPDIETYFSKFNRIKLNNEYRDGEIELTDFLDLAIEKINKHNKKSNLLVFNTIKSSLKAYEFFEENLPDYEIFYLSSNILPVHRRKRIDIIREKMKKDKKIILISTQVIEAGVDLDFEYVIRDFGPLDSIYQVSGRCNRNNAREKSLVELFKIKDERRAYSNYVYDSVLLENTNKTLQSGGSSIDEKDFRKYSYEYYKNLKEIASEDISNKILNELSRLKYEEALNPDLFSLIKKDFKTIDVFIEIDENAKKLWEQYNMLKEIDNVFERRKEYLKIKSQFLSYVVSIPEKFFEKKNNSGEKRIEYISNDSYELYYDMITGYKRDQKVEDYIF
jgi:CRISPR-associated endonuclease/helicase Cas3